jgi:hypothetical protein
LVYTEPEPEEYKKLNCEKEHRAGQSGERIAGMYRQRNKIYSLIRTITKYLLAEVAITASA